MKKLNLYILIIIGILLLSANKERVNSCGETDYIVSKIDSVKNWYIIYAVRNDSVFKIVSMKKQKNCFEKILTGNKYNLLLKKRIENVLSSKGLKLLPMNYLHIQGSNYDEATDVFINNEKGVFGLYTCDNLEGLCLK